MDTRSPHYILSDPYEEDYPSELCDFPHRAAVLADPTRSSRNSDRWSVAVQLVVYRRKAEECRLLAEKAKLQDVKESWQKFAIQWQRLAQEVDASNQQNSNFKPNRGVEMREIDTQPM
jgi:hypothetical protein